MTADEYLALILRREAVDTSITSPIRSVLYAVQPLIQRWAGSQLDSISPSGSFAKGTANSSGTDIDLFISLKSDTTNTLMQIYESLGAVLSQNGYNPRRQNVSLNVNVNGYSVDLVPARRQDSYSLDHSLYRRKADTWSKTNVATHINYVQRAGRIHESRILKLWRDQHGLDFPSFYLELTVIDALAGQIYSGGLASNVLKAFGYLRDSFPSARVVDPANTNNVISDDLTVIEKSRIKSVALAATNAKNWEDIVK